MARYILGGDEKIRKSTLRAHSVRFSCVSSYVRIWSPGLSATLRFSKPMPHSLPLCISVTSALTFFRDAIVPADEMD